MSEEVKTDTPKTTITPPKPKEELSALRDLPEGINFVQAQQCVELSAYCDNSIFSQTKYKNNEERINGIAEDLGLTATIHEGKGENLKSVIFFDENANEGAGKIVVGFSGSQPFNRKHYWRNLSFLKVVPSAFGEHAKIHNGFNKAMDKPTEDGNSLWEEVKQTIEELKESHPDAELVFTGHSAGGCFAAIAASRWICASENNHVDGLVTFGQPRLGGSGFKKEMESKIGKDKIIRFDMDGDPISALPPFEPPRTPAWGPIPSFQPLFFESYRHFGTWVPINRLGEVLEPNKVIDESTPEDTVSYKDGEEKPEWKDVIEEDGNTKSDLEIREATRRWFQFAKLDFAPHLLPGYQKSISILAHRQYNPNLLEDTFEVSDLDSSSLMYNLIELERLLFETKDPYKAGDLEGRLFVELRNAIAEVNERWDPENIEDTLILVESASKQLLSIIPKQGRRLDTELLYEQTRGVQAMARRMLNRPKDATLDRADWVERLGDVHYSGAEQEQQGRCF